MPTEEEWVDSIIPRLQNDLLNLLSKTTEIRVAAGSKLPYAYEVMKYRGNQPDQTKPSQYETDIMISGMLSEDEWIPRVIIESKLA